MSFYAAATFVVHCPGCGTEVIGRSMKISQVEFDPANGLLRINVDPIQELFHRCPPKPNSAATPEPEGEQQ